LAAPPVDDWRWLRAADPLIHGAKCLALDQSLSGATRTGRTERDLIGGVDVHLDTHTAAAIDALGRRLGHATFPATRSGYADLLAWLQQWGVVVAVGVEGTGSYGAGLARYLTEDDVRVVEVDRPDRKARRKNGKSDPVDAEAAARAVQAGTATGIPKTRDGAVESIRVLRVARRSAVKAHTAAINALHHLVTTAPDPLREHLIALEPAALIEATARLRPTDDLTDPLQATKRALRRLARRCQELATEIAEVLAHVTAARSGARAPPAAVGPPPDARR
jgi:transposase